MSITGAIVLYAISWFIVLFVNLQLGQRTQGDAGVVVPGTPSSAPAEFPLKRKVVATTMVATVIWAVISAVILSGWITVRNLDVFHRMDPEVSTTAGS